MRPPREKRFKPTLAVPPGTKFRGWDDLRALTDRIPQGGFWRETVRLCKQRELDKAGAQEGRAAPAEGRTTSPQDRTADERQEGRRST